MGKIFDERGLRKTEDASQTPLMPKHVGGVLRPQNAFEVRKQLEARKAARGKA